LDGMRSVVRPKGRRSTSESGGTPGVFVTNRACAPSRDRFAALLLPFPPLPRPEARRRAWLLQARCVHIREAAWTANTVTATRRHAVHGQHVEAHGRRGRSGVHDIRAPAYPFRATRRSRSIARGSCGSTTRHLALIGQRGPSLFVSGVRANRPRRARTRFRASCAIASRTSRSSSRTSLRPGNRCSVSIRACRSSGAGSLTTARSPTSHDLRGPLERL